MIRIGIIGPSEIAFRRFLPSLQKTEDFRYVGVAIATPEEWFDNDLGIVEQHTIACVQQSEVEKANRFADTYHGKVFRSYESLVGSDEVDAVYIPLPPALHYKWARKALLNGKHVLLEKPFTTSIDNTRELIALAKERGLALHEDYMFVYHNQLLAINSIISSGELGDVRLYRITFGFPRRNENDFRYNKELGGGALYDAGGYTIKLASILLGNGGKIVAATSGYCPGFDVDLYGSAIMVNEAGVVAHLAFGMDNDYSCDLEIWCSKGTLKATRVMTAPAGFVPVCIIKKNQEFETRELPMDDAFLKSIQRFGKCVKDHVLREENYQMIERQGALVESFKESSNLWA